jgi:hypothetical protein
VNRSTARRFAIGAVLGMLALSGCEPAQVGAAAVIDGRSIPLSEIQRTVQEIRDFQERVGVAGQSPETLAQDELQRRLILEVHERAAAALGVGATAGEVSEQLTVARRDAGDPAQFERVVAGNNLTEALLDEVFRQRVLREKMGELLVPNATTPEQRSQQQEQVTERLIQTANQMDVEINPRFGEFDSNTGALVERQDDFLAPVQEPEAPGLPGPPAPGDQE